MLAFMILVTVHEFGHYLFARLSGMRVDRFYLFFNPWFSLLKYRPDLGTVQLVAWTTKDKKTGAEVPHSLLKFKVGKAHPEKNGKVTWRDTLYGIGWIPLGGYCSVAGMIDETTDKEKLSAKPQEWEFRAKKPFPRFMVMIAGVLFNFILAIGIYIGIALYWGDRVIPYQQAWEGMDFSPEMQSLGARNGDILLTVNGKKADPADASLTWDMVQPGSKITLLRSHSDTVHITVPKGFLEKIALNDQKTIPMAYRQPAVVLKTIHGDNARQSGMLAGDRIVRVAADTTPSLTEFFPALQKHAGKTVTMLVMRDGKPVPVECAVNDAGKIGIQLTPLTGIYPVTEIKYDFFAAIPKGIGDGVERLTTYVSSLKLLFSKEGAKSVGGFGAIGDMFPDQWNWYAFWNITAFLSVILAVMNLLPIPALDGGHVLFILVEIVTRRRPGEKFLEYAQMAGMAFLLLLLVYANGNDIYRFFIK